MNQVKHILGISGGKDSAALAIYLTTNYPKFPLEYYFSDTGKELAETYEFIDSLQVFLGRTVTRLEAAQDSPTDPFDYFLSMYGGYLPSPQARWCTRKLKLEPFEQYIGDAPTISYVAIRGDENREGYISQKPNVQSIFPFRRNIWSQDVINKVLAAETIPFLTKTYPQCLVEPKLGAALKLATRPLSARFKLKQKLEALLDIDIPAFNRVVFAYLKTTTYPVGMLDDFPLLDNEANLGRDDIFRLLDESGVGRPKYYEPIPFEVNGETGFYNRSRSGCYFCFFQQKIEWIWLYEQHPNRFQKALAYEKDGFTWMQDETLQELVQPERMEQVKVLHLKQAEKAKHNKSQYLIDILDESEPVGCFACFV